MNIFKRFEIWVLLLLLVAATAFVLLTSREEPDLETALPPAPGSTAAAQQATPQETAPFTVDRIELKRDYDNGILQVHLTYDNRTGSDLQLVSPAAKLLGGPDPEKGDEAEEIAAFFLAFAPPPTIPSGGSSAAVLKFWVEKRHLENALWLQILQDRQDIKSPAPFDLESIPNQETRVLEGTDWVAIP